MYRGKTTVHKIVLSRGVTGLVLFFIGAGLNVCVALLCWYCAPLLDKTEEAQLIATPEGQVWIQVSSTSGIGVDIREVALLLRSELSTDRARTSFSHTFQLLHGDVEVTGLPVVDPTWSRLGEDLLGVGIIESEQACGWPMRSLWGGQIDSSRAPLANDSRLPWGVSPLITNDCRPPVRPVAIGFIFGGLLYGSAIGGIWYLGVSARRIIRLRNGLCPACGYRQDMLGSRGCPECGWNRPASESAE